MFYTFIFAVLKHILRYFIRYARLRRRKSICIPNFDDISQSAAEIKLLPITNDGRPPYWIITTSFDFDLWEYVIRISFCIRCDSHYCHMTESKTSLTKCTHSWVVYFRLEGNLVVVVAVVVVVA